MTPGDAAEFTLPRLYAILDVELLRSRGRDLGEAARSLARSGVTLVQLRDKASSPQDVVAHAAWVTEAFKGTGATLVMNDRPDLARLAGWRAVHLGHKDLPPEAAKALFPEGELIVGVSTHNDEQVRAAEKGPAEYVAVGPVFGTATKIDTEPVIGLEGVRRARQLTGKPLVAIGGITLANAATVIEAGADSVAVISALLAEGVSLEERAQDFLRRLR